MTQKKSAHGEFGKPGKSNCGPPPKKTPRTKITANDVVDGVAEGHTLTVNSQNGVLAGDKDSSGYALGVSAISSGATSKTVSSGGSATIQGAYGTLVMNANGSYSYVPKSSISFPPDGIVQETFTFTVTDSHGTSTQATLTLTVTEPGLQYVSGTPGHVLTAGQNATVLDASLGHQIVIAGNGNDVVLGGAFDAITVGNGNDTIIAGADDVIVAGDGNDTITGAARDIIVAGDGNDMVTGGADDLITLGDGNDVVVGGANDIIIVGNGKETITVGANNKIKVGKGADKFIFNQTAAAAIGCVVIDGFITSKDTIQFSSSLFANFAAVKAHAKQVGKDTVITLDKNDTITLEGVTLSSLQASNFVFTGASMAVTIDPVNGNNIINYAEAHAAGGVPLSGTVTGAAANSIFTVTVTDNAVTKTYTATVNGAGTGWTATIPSADAIALANGSANVTAQLNATTQASEIVTVAETRPTVTVNAVEGNNVINYTEAHAAGGVPLSGSVTGLAGNSTFTVMVTDNAVTKTYTATVNGAGTAWTATVPSVDAIALANGTATVSAQVTDTYGNQSTPASQTVTVAETRPTLTINAVDGNDVINYAEAHAAGGVPLSGSVTGLAGNSTFSVTVTDNAVTKTYTATVNGAGTSWTATIPSADAVALANGTAIVSAQVTDTYGNQSAPASQTVTVADTLPTVGIGTVAGDDVINYAETHAAGGVALSGSVSGLAGNSTFTVTVSNNGVAWNYTATVNGAGTAWSATIPMVDAMAFTNSASAVFAQATDAYGNTSPTTVRTITVANILPTVTISPVAGDDAINYAEAHAAGGVLLAGLVTGLAGNSTFTLTVADSGVTKNYTATVNGSGTGWTATIPMADATALVSGSAAFSAQVTDAYGNTSAPVSRLVTVANTLPTISIDAVTGDDLIDYAEAQAGVLLSGSVSGIAANSTFTVTVTDNSVTKSYTATVDGTGTSWSATIPSADAIALADGSAMVTAQVTDAYGNPSAPASQIVAIEEALPTVATPAVNPTTLEDYAVAITGFSVGDANGFALTLTLTGAATSTLTLSSIAGLSFLDGDGTADTAMTFSGSVADINAALNGMSYTPVKDFTGAAGFSFSVTDGIAPAVTGGVEVDVTPAEVHLLKGTGPQPGANADTILFAYPTIAAALADAQPGNIIDLAAHDFSAESPVTVGVDGLTFRGPSGATGVVLDLASSGVQTLNLDGSAPININGNDLGDTLVGNAGDNFITGGTGSDSISGGGGNDTLIGGGGNDMFFYTVGDGNVRVDGGSEDAGGSDVADITNNTATPTTFTIGAVTGGSEIVPTTGPDGTDILVSDGSGSVRMDGIEDINLHLGSGGDTVDVNGSLDGTALRTSTIHIYGGAGDDTIDLSQLTSDHDVVVSGGGGNDTVLLGFDAVDATYQPIRDGNNVLIGITVTHQTADGPVTYTFTDVTTLQFTSGAVSIQDLLEPPVVSVDPVDGTNVINHAEASGGVTLSGIVSGLAANSTFDVTVTDNGTTTTYTATVNGAGTGWTATIPPADALALADGTATVSAQVTNAYGNQSALVSQTVTVAETLPTVTVDPVDGNDVINYAEANAAGGVPLSGTVTGLAGNSTFMVSVTDNGVTNNYTATVDGSGTSWTATIPSADALSLADGDATVSAQVTDGYGNQSTTATQTVTVTETLPTVTIDLVNGNDIINFAEANAAGGVPLSGTVTGLASNSTFSVMVADNIVTNSYIATVDGSGTSWTATIPSADAVALADGSATVSAQVTDSYGNQSTLAAQIVTVTETLPTVTIDPVDGNDVINNAEANAAGGVPLSGTVSGLAAGSTFTVTVTDNGVTNSYTATVDGAGTSWTATIPSADAMALADGSATVSAQVTDTYGNPSTNAVQTVTIAETLPTVSIDAVADDDVVSTTEAASGFAITGTTTDVADGEFVTVNILNAASVVIDSYQASVTAGAWTASVSAGDASALGAGSFTATADVADGYGNAALEATQGFTVQSFLAAPVFDLAKTDQAGPPGTHEAQAAKVTLVGTTGAGDTLTLLSTGATTLSDNLGNFQFSNVALALGDNFLTVQVTDGGGQTNQYTLDVQRLAPTGSADQAVTWNQITQQAIANDASIPEYAARALAMESLAVFDAVSAIDGTPGYLFNAVAAADASADAAVAQAAHDVLIALFPAQTAAFDALLAQSLAAVPAGQGKIDGMALGATVAAEIVALRANDGWNALVIDNGSTAVGEWRPTGPSYMPGGGGQYATVTPFALTSPDQFLPPPPPDLTSQAYTDALIEDQTLGSATNSTRTADQTQIAKFWADGVGTYTPPGQWNSIADQVSIAESSSLSANARLFAELNVAEADSAIAAWNAKYSYNLWRPITAIQNADEIGNPALTEDPNWQPLVITPNFPSYVSAHSTFSAAAAEVLSSIFGDNYAFDYTDPSYGSTPGVTRDYTSFWDAADEAGISRIYGGIHYSFDNTAGLTLGTQVGDWTLQVFDQANDTIPPKVILDETFGFITNTPPTITGHVTDNLSGVVALMASLDGAAYVPVAFDPATGAFSIPSGLAADGSADGNHLVSLLAFDAAGNQSAISNMGFTLDSTTPAITLDPASVQPGGVLFDGEHLTGTANPAVSSLVALNYSFDGGTANPVTFNASTGAFDTPIDYSKLSVGAHTLTISATDSAGNTGTDSLQVMVTAPPALKITSLTPASQASDVGVTYRPQIKFSRAVDVSTLTRSTFFATDTTGAVIPANIVPFTDGTGAWMLFSGPMPGGSTITLHIDGTDIKAADGAMLDAAGTGIPGSNYTETFSTVSTAGIPGTTLYGILADPGPDLTPMTPDDIQAGPNGLGDFANDTYKLPIVGAKVYILGHEDEAVYTGPDGSFTLADVPAGDVKVEIDGTTATNAPPGYYFPSMVMDVHVQPGVANTVMGGMGNIEVQAANATNPSVYLPRIQTSILQPLSTTQATIITAPLDSTGASGSNLTPQQAGEISLTVQPNSLVDENGNPVVNAQVGISTVPSSVVLEMLPAGLLQHSFDITIQAPGGAVFTSPAVLTMPNVFGSAPGSKLDILSFDHTTGRLVIDGTATVSADGLTVTSDPGTGVLAPGWHGVTPPGSTGDINPKPNPSPSHDPNQPHAPNPSITFIDKQQTFKEYLDAVQRTRGNTGLQLSDSFDVIGMIPGSPSAAAAGISKAATDTYNAVDSANKTYDDPNSTTGDKLLAAADVTKNAAGLVTNTLGVVPGPVGATATAVGAGLTAVDYTSAAAFTSYFQWYYDVPELPPVPKLTQAQRDALQRDPPLVISLSEDGWNGDAQFTVDVDGQEVLGPTTVTASHANGASQTFTIDLDDTGPHSVTVNFINPATGTVYNEQRNLYINGMTFNGQGFATQDVLYGANGGPNAPVQITSATFTVGDGVTTEQTAFETASQEAVSEGDYQVPILAKADADAAILKPYFQTLLATQTVTAANLAQVMSKSLVLEDFLNQWASLAGHPYLPDMVTRAAAAFAPFATELQNEIYAQIAPTLPAVQFGQTMWAELQADDGSIQRFEFNPSGPLNYFLAPNTFYTLTLYDPTTNYIGTRFFESGPSGSTTNIPQVAMVPDPGPFGADGLSDMAAAVIGVNNAIADNLVPGVTDLAALQAGLVTNASLTGLTGVIASVKLNGEADAIALVGSAVDPSKQIAYVATGSYGLAIVDVSNRTQPKILGQLQLGGGSTAIVVDDALHRAAVTVTGGIAVVDISNPQSPYLIYSRPIPANAVATANGVLYVQNGTQLQALDFSTGSLIAATTIGASPVDGMLVEGSDLYVMHASGLLQIIDVSSPVPSVIGSLSVASNSGKMAYGDGVLYVGDGTDVTVAGYSTIDVSDPTAPALIADGKAAFPQPGVAGRSLALTGAGTGVFVEELNVSSGGQTVEQHLLDLVNVTDPTDTNAITARYQLPSAPMDVAIGQGTAFVADGTGGLVVVNYATPDTSGVAPVVTVTSLSPDVDTVDPGLQLFEGQQLSVKAKATDSGQITRVELLVNGQVVNTDISYPWNLTATLPSIAENGGQTVTIQVRATDNGGNVGLSTPITAELITNPAPFALVSISPSAGSNIAGTQRHITVTFNEPVDPGSVSVSTFTLIDGDGNTYTPSSINIQTGGKVVDFTFDTLPPGTFTETIDAANVLNTIGDALGPSLITSQFTVVPFDDVWTGAGNGNWTDPNDWSTLSVPIPAENVLVSLPGGTQATVSSDVGSVLSLNVTGAGQLVISSPSTYGLETGTLDNSGTVRVQKSEFIVDGALHNSGAILIDANTTDTAVLTSNAQNFVIDGGGTITLSNTLPSYDVSFQISTGNDRLTAANQDVNENTTLENVDNTITGTGHIGVGAASNTGNILDGDKVINDAQGVIKVTGTDYLEINSVSLVNHGLIEVQGGTDPMNGCFLDFSIHFDLYSPPGGGIGSAFWRGVDLDNTDGLILASGAGSSIDFLGTIIHGGTMQTESGGSVWFLESGLSASTQGKISGPAVLDGTTSAISIIGTDPGTLGSSFVLDATNVEGTIINHSFMNIIGAYATAPGYSNRTGALALIGDTTLQGGGIVELARPGNALSHGLDVGIVDGAFDTTETLTNVDNTITGAGTIGYAPNLKNTFFSPSTSLAIINEAAGSIIASQDDNPNDDPFAHRMDIVDVDLTNYGLISVTATGGMLIQGSTIRNLSGGQMSVDDFSEEETLLDIEGSFIYYGTLSANSYAARITIDNTTVDDTFIQTLYDGAVISIQDSSISNRNYFQTLSNATITIDATDETDDTVEADADYSVINIADFGTLTTSTVSANGAGSTISIQDITLTNSSIAANGVDASVAIQDSELDYVSLAADGDGSTITVENGTFTDAVIEASGDGASVTIQDSAMLTDNVGTTVLAEGSGSTIAFINSTIEDAQFEIDSGATLSFTGNYDVTFDTFTGSGGHIVITDGSTLTAQNIGINTVTSIGSGSTFEMSLFLNGSAVFSGNGNLIIDQPILFSGAIVNFLDTDQIDLRGFDSDPANLNWDYQGDDMSGYLHVTDDNGHEVYLNLAFNGPADFSGDPGSDFSFNDDGQGGTVITTDLTLRAPVSTIDNSGLFTVGDGGDTDNVHMPEDTTLQGGGMVELTGGGFLSDGSFITFTNLDNTISGSGQIGDDVIKLFNAPAGKIIAEAGDDMSIWAYQTLNAGLIEADGGSIYIGNDVDEWHGQGSISAINGGYVTLSGDLYGNGQNRIGDNSTLEAWTIEDGTTTTFTGNNATFVIDHASDPDYPGGGISGFVQGDTIDLRDISFVTAGLDYSGTVAGGTLTINDGTNMASLLLFGNYMAAFGDPSDAHFTVAQDFQGGTLIMTDITKPHA